MIDLGISCLLVFAAIGIVHICLIEIDRRK